MGHVFEGNLCMPKINCFLALPMYCPVLNFSILVFCASVISGLFQKSLDILLSTMGLVVHLLMLGKFSASIYRLFSWSCFFMYLSKHLTGPLSGRLILLGHVSFWK